MSRSPAMARRRGSARSSSARVASGLPSLPGRGKLISLMASPRKTNFSVPGGISRLLMHRFRRPTGLCDPAPSLRLKANPKLQRHASGRAVPSSAVPSSCSPPTQALSIATPPGRRRRPATACPRRIFRSSRRPPEGASVRAGQALGYLHGRPPLSVNGEVSERPKEHAWKVCIRKRIVGSNPTLSAKKFNKTMT